MSLRVDRLWQQSFPFTIVIQHLDKFHDTAFAVKFFAWVVSVLFIRPVINQDNADPFVEERQLAQTSREDIPMVYRVFKNGAIRFEMYNGTGTIGYADLAYFVLGYAFTVFL